MSTRKLNRYAVIGGAGFIGHHIANTLIERGDEVIIIDNLSTGRIENVHPKAEFHKIDISHDGEEKRLIKILEGVDTVYLTAAQTRVQPSMIDPIGFNKINVEGVVRVLDACRYAKVRRVVYSASSSVYGETTVFPTPEHDVAYDPMSPYALQKYIGEQYCKLYSRVFELDTVCLRYFNVYGEGMPTSGAYRMVISIFGEQYQKDQPLTYVNDGDQRRDFTYVMDVVNANILAGDYPEQLNGDVFNVGNGDNFSVNDVIEMFGCESKFLENRIEPSCTLADTTKLQNKFGWRPNGDLKAFIEQYKIDLKK